MGSPEARCHEARRWCIRAPSTGNPISAAAGIATLTALRNGKLISEMNRLSDLLRTLLNDLFAEKRLRMCGYGSYSMPHVGCLKRL